MQPFIHPHPISLHIKRHLLLPTPHADTPAALLPAGRKPSSSFLAAAASRFLEQPGSYKPKELSSLVFALAKLAVASGTALPQAPALADAVAQQLQQRAAQFDVESLCSSVWAVVKLGQYVPVPVLEVVSAQLLRKVGAAVTLVHGVGMRQSQQACMGG